MQDSALTNGAAAENFGEEPNMETALTQESVHVSGNGHSIDANNPVSSASTSCGLVRWSCTRVRNFSIRLQTCCRLKIQQARCNFVVAHKFTGKSVRVNQRNWHRLRRGMELSRLSLWRPEICSGYGYSGHQQIQTVTRGRGRSLL